jgi:hypothetical protein
MDKKSIAGLIVIAGIVGVLVFAGFNAVDFLTFRTEERVDTMSWACGDLLITAENRIEDNDIEGARVALQKAAEVIDDMKDFQKRHGEHEGSVPAMISLRECELKRLMGELEEKEWRLGYHTGRVVKVLNGDTFVMWTDEIDPATGRHGRLIIRIQFPKCPGSEEGCGYYTDYYYQATERFKDLILGKEVKVNISGSTIGWLGTTVWLAGVTYEGRDLARIIIEDLVQAIEEGEVIG